MPYCDQTNDLSNGWEEISGEFLVARSSIIGAATVQEWAKSFEPGREVLDVGCGFGGPYTSNLVSRGLKVYGVDASVTLINEYLRRFPGVLAQCEPAEASSFFSKKFDGVLSVGLIFLLSEKAQLAVLEKMAEALKGGGSLLFNAPYQVGDWDDLLTGEKSVSLGRERYVGILQAQGLTLVNEFTDEGKGHYYEFRKHG